MGATPVISAKRGECWSRSDFIAASKAAASPAGGTRSGRPDQGGAASSRRFDFIAPVLAQPCPHMRGVANVVAVVGPQDVDVELPVGVGGVTASLLAPEVFRLVVRATPSHRTVSMPIPLSRRSGIGTRSLLHPCPQLAELGAHARWWRRMRSRFNPVLRGHQSCRLSVRCHARRHSQSRAARPESLLSLSARRRGVAGALNDERRRGTASPNPEMGARPQRA